MKRPSINHIYRLVWNESKNAYVPAAENTKTHAHPTRTNRLALALSTLLLPSLLFGDGVVVAAGSGGTKVYNAPNGIPVINIDRANSAGISHNKYTNYNVGTNGLILNNGNSTQMTRQSQLAGQIMANTNLSAEARIIINEVVAPNRSQLLGYTEVLGGKADVIVSNPYGITCAGCGFINTDRVTLTTGTPNIAGNGELSGFSINRGDILIQGSGLDGTNQNYFDILARAVKIDAQINTKDLKVVTGTNTWDYATSQATAVQPTGTVPELAIDSTLLGGMYANRIKIIANESGVGVKMLGEAAVLADDFILTTSGKIELKNKISAERDIAITYNGSNSNATDMLEIGGGSAELAAKRHINIEVSTSGVTLGEVKLTAGENLNLNAATLNDTSSANAVRFASADMSVNVFGGATFSGTKWGSGGETSLHTQTLSAADTVFYSGANSDASNKNLLISASNSITLNNSSATSGAQLYLGEIATQNISINATSTVKAASDAVLMANDVINIEGSVQSGNTLTLKAGDTIATLINTGSVQSNALMTLGETGHILDISNNTSGVFLAGSLSVHADDIVNAGTIQSTLSSTFDTVSITNQLGGKLFVSTQSGEDGTITVANSVVNAGVVQSSGQLGISSGSSITNTGTILSLKSANGGNDEALNLSSVLFSNSGTIEGSGILNVNTTALSGIALDNSGSIQSVGAISLASGTQMTNTGNIIGDGSITIGTNLSSFTLSNTGRIQSGSDMVLGSSNHTIGLINQSAGTLLAGATLGVVGGSFSNAGTIQANTGTTVSGTTLTNSSGAKFLISTVSGSDGSLTFTSTVDNQGNLQSAGGLTLSSSSTISNTGTLKATGDTDAITLQALTMTNSGYIDGTGQLIMTLSASGGTALNNSSQIHSLNSMNITSAGAISNTGSILGGNSITFGTNQSSFTLSNTGRIQSAGAMSLGTSSHLAIINNQSSGTLFSGETLGITGGAIDNQGKMYADSGMTWSVSSLQNGSGSNANALILGAMTSGSSTFSLTGSLTNYGAIHSNDNFNITSYGITNTNTGGISSLSSLSLSSNGGNNIDNYGALYSGNAMSLNSFSGTIYNHSDTGTIDSGGSLTTSSMNFTNNNAIVVAGNININTTNAFTNETTLASGATLSKTLGDATGFTNWQKINQLYTENGIGTGADIYAQEDQFTRTESLSGVMPSTKAQIIANGVGSTITINYGTGTGLNKIAVLSAPTINISGTGTFTNEDLTLYEYTYKRRWITNHDTWFVYYVFYADFYSETRYWGRTDSNQNGWAAATGDNFDYYAYNPGNGWGSAKTNENDAKTDALQGAVIFGTPVVVQSFGTGIFATNFNFSGGTLNNVGSPWPTDPTRAKMGSATSGSVNRNPSPSDGSVENSLSVLGSETISTRTKSSVIAGSTLSFSGLNLTLPSNPNGYFVVSKNPSATYLIETNPLFAVGTNFVGSDYMAERYGINPDDVTRRLGDASYEAYLVRQQLIQQMGTNLIKGYGDEASQIQRLMDQAINQGHEIGLVYGKPLSPSQIAGLTSDIIWMEEVEIGGQKVLAPRVYLSKVTKDSILTGAAISAENVAISGDGLNNTGGTIEGSENLNVTVKNDITNTSGTIQGGNVSLTSTEGSIVNQTYTEGHGDDIQYSTSIGKTGGIKSTGDLNMDAKKDITVLGADVNAGGDATLSAGKNITFDTIVDKSTTSSSSSTNLGFYTSSTSTTETSEKNIGSNLSSGGKLKLKSGNDITIGGSNVTADRGMDVDATGSFNVEARQDKLTSTSKTETSGIGVGGGLYGTESTTTDTFKGTNKGSTIQVGTVENQEKRNTLQNELDNKASALSSNAKDLMALKDQYLNSDKNSPEGQALLAKLKSQYAEYKQQLAEANELQSQLSELPSGDLNVKAGNTFKLQGSDLTVYGNASIDAKAGIEILDGLDEERTTTTTTTTTFMKMDGDGTNAKAKAESNAEADASAQSNKKRATAKSSAESSASAEAEASSEHNLKLAETTTTTTEEGSKTSVASNLNVSGNLSAKTDGKMTIQGSNLDIGGDASLEANTIEVLTGKNETYSSTNTTSTSIGFYEESGADSSASADASASAEAKKRNSIIGTPGGSANAQAQANAGAEANAESTITIGARTENSSESNYELTNTSSTIKVGGNLSMKAKEKASFTGADVESVGDMTIEAQTIENKAAQDISLSTSSSSKTTAGLYIGGEANANANANADAEAKANAGILGPNMGGKGSAEAGAGASVELTAGIRAAHESESSAEGSTTNVTNTFKAGGNFKRTATDTILDQGTSIEAGGNIEQSAKIIKEEAIHDSTFSTEKSQSHDARIGVYAGAEAEANTDSGADASASAGLKASYEGNIANESSSSKTAVTTKYKAGGSISSTSTESTTLVGTQFEAGKDITIEAGSLDYKSAYDSESEKKANHDISAEGKMSMYGTPGVSAEGSYEGSMEGESSTTARTGSINAGGNIKIKTTQGDANFEGTNIEGKQNVEIQSAGSVNYNAAYDTSSSNELNINASVGFSSDKKESETSAEAGFEMGNSFTKTAKTGSIKGNNITISSTKDITLEGTKVSSTNNTTLDAGGDVKLKAATNTETSVGLGVSGGLGKSKNDEGTTKSMEAEGSAEFGHDVTSQTTSIESGGKLSIKGNTVTNQEADLKSKEGTNITGTIINEKATDYTLSAEIDGKASVEEEKKNPKAGSKTTDDISDKRPKASDAITKKYASEAPELGQKGSDTSSSKESRQAEIQKLKEGWNTQKEKIDKVLEPKTTKLADAPSNDKKENTDEGKVPVPEKKTTKPNYMNDTISISAKKVKKTSNP